MLPTADQLVERFVVGRLTDEELVGLEAGAAQVREGWLGYGVILDPRLGGAGNQVLLGVQRDNRSARACYAKAVEAGQARGRFRLGKSLLDSRAGNSLGDRKLGFALVLSVAIEGLGVDGKDARARMKHEYSRAGEGRKAEGPVLHDSEVAAAWGTLAASVETAPDSESPAFVSARDAAWRWARDRAAERDAAATLRQLVAPLNALELQRRVSGTLNADTDRRLSALLPNYNGWYELGKAFDPIADRSASGPGGRPRDLVFALRSYVRAWQAGRPKGLRRLGQYMVHGAADVEGSRPLGVELLIHAALAGELRAMGILAKIYGQDMGYETVVDTPDLELGGAWYRLSRGVGDDSDRERAASKALLGDAIPADELSAWRQLEARGGELLQGRK